MHDRRVERVMRRFRAFVVFALCIAAPVDAARAQATTRLAAPNVVEISERLVTSGQPSAMALASLKALGFDAVIYLAPATVSDAVPEEPRIVTGQGLVFINLPVQFDAPSARDYETFAALLKGLGTRKVLVHCQINLRASSFVFLYRVLALGDVPRQAYEALSSVWVPHGPWRRLIETELRDHHIDFELL
jgi:protein tyrosine phosphatase (PTP) superfamily phosphohydrolase (DUF442 family)